MRWQKVSRIGERRESEISEALAAMNDRLLVSSSLLHASIEQAESAEWAAEMQQLSKQVAEMTAKSQQLRKQRIKGEFGSDEPIVDACNTQLIGSLLASLSAYRRLVKTPVTWIDPTKSTEADRKEHLFEMEKADTAFEKLMEDAAALTPHLANVPEHERIKVIKALIPAEQQEEESAIELEAESTHNPATRLETVVSKHVEISVEKSENTETHLLVALCVMTTGWMYESCV